MEKGESLFRWLRAVSWTDQASPGLHQAASVMGCFNGAIYLGFSAGLLVNGREVWAAIFLGVALASFVMGIYVVQFQNRPARVGRLWIVRALLAALTTVAPSLVAESSWRAAFTILSAVVLFATVAYDALLARQLEADLAEAKASLAATGQLH